MRHAGLVFGAECAGNARGTRVGMKRCHPDPHPGGGSPTFQFGSLTCPYMLFRTNDEPVIPLWPSGNLSPRPRRVRLLQGLRLALHRILPWATAPPVARRQTDLASASGLYLPDLLMGRDWLTRIRGKAGDTRDGF